MKNIQIDIVSDVACPWCAIGYARLERAMKTLAAEYEFTVQWHAFELNPEHSGKGEPILPALAKKYGRSEQEMQTNQANMMVIAQELGINFDCIQQRLTCNTFDAHRLLKWAAERGQQTALKKALFSVYFGQAQDISDHQVLLDSVTSLGLDATTAEQVLASNQYADLVRSDEATYQQAGITSVPAFIINGKYLIAGAQEADAWVKALHEISAEHS